MTTVVHAAKCVIQLIDTAIADEFLSRFHRAKALSKKSNTTSYGLFYKDQLVGVAQFGLPRTSKMLEKYSAELYRLCFAENWRVIEGASHLIQFYIMNARPTVADFFTYQDTTGENTKVYQHSGMTLVKDGTKTKKQYLVAPGKTLKTGSRKEVLGMAYATRYGPDRILGTQLGEVFDEAGRRKTNKRLFVEELGWHIEETTGDSVWEWHNPNMTHYTYKITASDSDKYYYGVSHVKRANATVEDCLNDGYMGSGGGLGRVKNKFSLWREKHKNNLVKEIVNIFDWKSEAYADERRLVGDLNKTDPLCLNTRIGGSITAPIVKDQLLKNCHIHGKTPHQGDSCAKCSREKANRIDICKKHGETMFRGKVCAQCIVEDTKIVRNCPKHGETLHQGKTCCKCNAEKSVIMSSCSIHGFTKFKNTQCAKCIKARSYSEKECPIHGFTKFTGTRCQLCVVRSSKQLGDCDKHGYTMFKKNECILCSEDKKKEPLVSVKYCAIHGNVKHRRNTCYMCIGQRRKNNGNN